MEELSEMDESKAKEMKETASRKTIGIIIGLMLSLFVAALDSTVMSTAMPTVAAELGGADHYNWPFTSYLLTCTIATLLCGGFASTFGHRRLFIIGISVFTVASVLCATSRSIEMLALWRLFEGAGGGLVEACVFIATADLFEPRERGRYMGIITSVYGIASVAGPLLGGSIAQGFSWQWIFLINVPFGIAALAMVVRFLPKQRDTDRTGFDIPGSSIAVFAVVPLVLAFSLAGSAFALPSAQFVTLIVLAALLTCVLFHIERKRIDPVVPVALFQRPAVDAAFAFGFSTQFALLMTIVVLPRFLQTVMKTDAFESGLALTALVLTLIVGSNLAGAMFRKTGRMRKPALLSCAIVAGAAIALSQMSFIPDAIIITFISAILGFGVGMGMPLSNIAAQVGADRRDIGKATSMVLFFRGLGGTVGTAVCGALTSPFLLAGVAPSFIVVAAVAGIAALSSIALPRIVVRHTRTS